MTRTRQALLLVILLIGISGSATAAPIISFTPAGSSVTGAGVTGTFGWQFDVVASGGITVTHLGLLDHASNGLAQPHQVSIWNNAGTLLATGGVPAGTVAPLDVNGLFRLVDIVDVLLPQAAGYRIGAYYLASSPDYWYQAAQVGGLQVNPAIQYVGARYAIGSTITDPIQPSPNGPGPFGASFQIADVVVTPEPSTLLLLGIGLLGVGARLKRRV